ncbi:hypothetical protein ACLKA7_006448 [Drosophila subpalustris]
MDMNVPDKAVSERVGGRFDGKHLPVLVRGICECLHQLVLQLQLQLPGLFLANKEMASGKMKMGNGPRSRL